ncbi:MAG: helix-turn-helix domain-containing protein [Calditrichia bacterium]
MLFLMLMLLGSARRLSGIQIETAPYWTVHLWGAMALIFGPLIYFYVRTAVDSGYLFKASRLLHFIPALIHLSLLLPLLPAEPELRSMMISGYLEHEIYRSMIPGIRIGFIVTCIYVLLSFFWIRRFEKHVLNVASFRDEISIQWLKLFTGLLVMLFLLLAVFTLRTPYQLMAGLAMFIFMSAITFIALVRPEVFHGISSALKLSGKVQEDERYVSSQLDDTQKAAHLNTLKQHFEQNKPYLTQELTLRDAAKQIDIPYRYVSQVVNEQLDQNFMDFVNGYRVEAAKSMLVDPALAHISIDGIAGDAGFKSRSTFYAAFKKATGVSPGTFRSESPSTRAE